MRYFVCGALGRLHGGRVCTAGTALEPVKNMEDLQRVYHMVLYAAAFSVYLHPLVSKPTPGSTTSDYIDTLDVSTTANKHPRLDRDCQVHTSKLHAACTQASRRAALAHAPKTTHRPITTNCFTR